MSHLSSGSSGSGMMRSPYTASNMSLMVMWALQLRSNMLWQMRPTLLTLQWYTCRCVKINARYEKHICNNHFYITLTTGNHFNMNTVDVKTAFVCILSGYTCDKANERRLHWVFRTKLAVQLKHSFLIWCVRRSLHENPPER